MKLMSVAKYFSFVSLVIGLPVLEDELEADSLLVLESKKNSTQVLEIDATINSTEILEFDFWAEEDESNGTSPIPDEISQPKEQEEERDEEEVACDTPPDTFDPFRNGLSDDSYSVWSDKRIPYVIGEGFNSTAVDNINEAITNYNTLFQNCITWTPRSTEAVYVEFINDGSCFSKIGRAYWPFPVSQSIYIGKCAHLVGHIKHEMMHTLGFYHEHSRSDRDMYVDIKWSNIQDGRSDQFQTYRWTTGYGEKYDYNSIMHYSKTAFSKSDSLDTIVPKFTDPEAIGKKVNLSETDITKIKKLYKCPPYDQWENGCDKDDDCGYNEYCTTLLSGYVTGQCRTQLPNGSLCVRNRECLNTCSGGICTSCTEDSQCPENQYCANKYLPFSQNICSGYCGELCLLTAQCGGACKTCAWSFTCK